MCVYGKCVYNHTYVQKMEKMHTHTHIYTLGLDSLGICFRATFPWQNRMIPVVRNRKEIGAVQTDVEIEVLGNNVVEQLGQQFQQDSSPTGTGGWSDHPSTDLP